MRALKTFHIPSLGVSGEKGKAFNASRLKKEQIERLVERGLITATIVKKTKRTKK